ncbi:hypothetical protein D3C78_1323080 [compost metagenome]
MVYLPFSSVITVRPGIGLPDSSSNVTTAPIRGLLLLPSMIIPEMTAGSNTIVIVASALMPWDGSSTAALISTFTGMIL